MDAGAEVAIAALSEARCIWDGSWVKPETAVARLARAIEQKQRRADELDSALESASGEAQSLAEAQARHEELSDDLRQLDREHLAARLCEVRYQIRSAQANAGDARALAAELESFRVTRISR